MKQVSHTQQGPEYNHSLIPASRVSVKVLDKLPQHDTMWDLAIAPDDTVSPGVLRKMVYAGSHASSFQQASKDLKEEAELDVSDQRIMRATKRIGQERVAERDAETNTAARTPPRSTPPTWARSRCRVTPCTPFEPSARS